MDICTQNISRLALPEAENNQKCTNNKIEECLNFYVFCAFVIFSGLM
jgi:hypothetical protein